MGDLHETDNKATNYDNDECLMTEEDMVAMDQYDYIRLTASDIHGIGRCKAIPRRHFRSYARRGVDLFAGLVAFGPRSEIIPIKEVLGMGDGNAILLPMTRTLKPLPWATKGKYKIGEVLCETFWTKPYRNGDHQDACPRYVARKQIQRLDELGYSLYSSFEAEFIVYKHGTRIPIYEGHDIVSTRNFSEFETYIYGLDENLIQAGIDTGTFQTEYGDGQFEFAIKPTYGIDAADCMFRFKHAVKEMSLLQDLDAIFMTKPECQPGSESNGLHFNHSLWSISSKENAFHDPNSGDGLSIVARQWIAGLVKHARGLTALCSPTVNCYRRLHNEPCPDRANWGIQNRFSSFRVKNSTAHETYVENRIPSGSANPYLVMAATLAAGISGIKEKLEAPPQRQDNEEPLPISLSEALEALEQDQVLVDALGHEFVSWFVKIKREIEVNALGETNIEKEWQLYSKML